MPMIDNFGILCKEIRKIGAKRISSQSLGVFFMSHIIGIQYLQYKRLRTGVLHILQYPLYYFGIIILYRENRQLANTGFVHFWTWWPVMLYNYIVILFTFVVVSVENIE